MTDTVFFDLDNTIFDFSKAERIALLRTLDKMGLSPTEGILSRYSEINASQWKRLERGEIDRAEVKKGRYRILFEEFGVDADPVTAAKTYEGFLGQGHYFIEGAPELLESLYGRYRLYLVTNGTTCVQKGRIASAGIAKYFEEIFISEEIGYDKPSARFFEYCFGRIPDFSKDRAVIVGDSLTSDIQGGINAGIRTIWFNPKSLVNDTDIRPDLEAGSLLEIPELL